MPEITPDDRAVAKKKPRGFDDEIRATFLKDIQDTDRNPTHDLTAAIRRLAEWAASGSLPKGATYSDLKWMYDRICEELHRRNPKSTAGGSFPKLGSGKHSLEGIDFGEGPDGGRGSDDLEERCQALTSALSSAAEERSIESPVDRFLSDSRREITVEVRAANIDPDKRTADIAFSSEFPVARPFGNEILDHSPGSVRMERINRGAPLLLNHDHDRQIGVVDRAFIGDDRRGRATVRFSRSPLGQEIFKDVQDGIRRLVSTGYRLHGEPTPEGENSYRFRDWEPLELSIVPIPADHTVGVGRGDQFKHTLEGDRQMPNVNNPDGGTVTPTVDVKAIEDEARKAESDRVRSIYGLAQKWGRRFDDLQPMAQEFVEQRRSVADFRDQLLARLEDAGDIRPAKPADLQVGLTDGERKDFSLVRLINYEAAVRKGEKAPSVGQFEHEVVEEASKIARQHGREVNGVIVPQEVLAGIRMGDLPGMDTKQLQRALQLREVQVGGTGGELVATNLLAQDFIELLRVRTPVMSLGPTHLPGLVGNIAIPRQSGAASTYWVAESVAPTESDQTFDQVSLTPKTNAANTKYSRKTLLQATPAIEGLVRADLAEVMGIALDLACINGSGTAGQPTGILNTTGVGSVVMTADTADGGAPAWADIVAFRTTLAKAYALRGNLAWLMNAEVEATLLTTPKVTGYPVFLLNDADQPLVGHKYARTENVPSNLTKGTGTGLSAMIFGNFRDLVIGEWGGLDMIVDPYSYSTQGGVQITIFRDVDVNVRHPESFAVANDIVTS